MVSERSVLIVDRSAENREVLKSALEHRGMCIYAASGPRRGLELARQHAPDLIVLDLDGNAAPPEELYAPFAEHAEDHATRLILIGGRGRRQCESAGGEFVAKPYHYAPPDP